MRWDALQDAGGAQHLGIAKGNQDRAFRMFSKGTGNRDRA